MTLARALLGIGRQQRVPEFLREAERLLEELLTIAERGGRLGRAIEMRIIHALALDALEERSAALESLERALELAAPEGYVRLFVDEGEPVRALLSDCQARIKTGPRRAHLIMYVATLLSAFPAPAVQSPVPTPNAELIEPLSERELEILKLIAAGNSNQEIAQKLFLTVGTVKWHVNHILGKLNARNRHAAVTWAADVACAGLNRDPLGLKPVPPSCKKAGLCLFTTLPVT